MNEFTENDENIACGNPDVFLFGETGIGPGSVHNDRTQHIIQQYTGAAKANPHLPCNLFSQRQRHAVSRQVALTVKNHPHSFDAFMNAIVDEGFEERLREATAEPSGKVARKLMEELLPHVSLAASRVPFGPFERARLIRHVIGMSVRFGLPSGFDTHSPHDLQMFANVRGACLSKNNSSFPATCMSASGEHFLEWMLHANDETFDSQLRQADFPRLVSANAATAAEVFRHLTECRWMAIYGIMPEHLTKTTHPMGSDPLLPPSTTNGLYVPYSGVFGTVMAALAAFEAQGRGSLHDHDPRWGSIPPHLLRAVAGMGEMERRVTAVLDRIHCAHASLEMHVQSALDTMNNVRRDIPARVPCPVYTPLSQAMLEEVCLLTGHDETTAAAAHLNKYMVLFDVRVNCCLHSTQYHSHANTCGKGGCAYCRMGFPRTEVEVTQAVELEIYVDPERGFRANGKMKESVRARPEGVTRLPEDTGSLRNYDTHPIDMEEIRLIVYEMARPKTPVDEASLRTLPEAMQQAIQNLTVEQRVLLLATIATKNTVIVDFNRVLIALLGCNVAIYLLGSRGIYFKSH